jgi:hypothetical protein
MAVVTQRLISDGESSATIELMVSDDASVQTDTLLDLSTLRGADGATLRARISRIFYSISGKPVSALNATVDTDHIVFIGWDTGGMMPDIIVSFPSGSGVINEAFHVTPGATSGNIVYYIEPYTVVTLHITVDKLAGFPSSTKR